MLYPNAPPSVQGTRARALRPEEAGTQTKKLRAQGSNFSPFRIISLYSDWKEVLAA